MKKILVIEDDVDIHNFIKKILEKENYEVISTYLGRDVDLLLENNNIDLVLLDLMLPDISGEEVLKKIKDIPVIVISAKIASEDKVSVLSNGANDYITKPFDVNELLARIKVQFRLNQKEENKDLKYKDLSLDKTAPILHIKAQKINLTKTEYLILKQLLLNPKKVISKTKLIQIINSNDKVTPEIMPYDESSLKVHISNIRKKIKNITEEEYIESVWGIGFKLYD